MFTYGNWGGTKQVDWSVPAKDALDLVFLAHRKAIAHGAVIRHADCQLVNTLMDTTVKGVYANIFKWCVVVKYGIKVYFCC